MNAERKPNAEKDNISDVFFTMLFLCSLSFWKYFRASIQNTSNKNTMHQRTESLLHRRENSKAQTYNNKRYHEENTTGTTYNKSEANKDETASMQRKAI